MYPTAYAPQYPFNSPMMPMMAGGGVASLANQVQDKGRGPDTMLVHMAPSEVAGLQALAMAHGGSLSINPETGLPEAGFLKNLLPTLIGAGLTFFSGGAINPMTAGMLVGGFEGIRKKDLGQGILAGLGAFGGAGLGASLAGSASSGLAPSIGAEAAGTTAMQNEATRQAASMVTPDALAKGFDMSAITGAGQKATADFASQGLGSQLKGSLATLGQPGGFSNLGSNLMTQYGGTTGSVLAATPTVMSVSEALTPKMEFAQAPTEKSNYAGPYVPTDRDLRFPTEEERRSSREFSFFSPSNPVPGYRPYNAAQGGLMDLARGGSFDDEPGSDGYAEGGKLEERGPIQMPGADYVAGTDPEFNHGFKPVQVQGAPDPNMGDAIVGKLFGNVPSSIGGKGVMAKLLRQVGGDIQSQLNPKDLENYKYDPQTQQLVKKAGGGLTALAGGRFLQGPGDGTSDSIPAVIANKQPARLADGEFVVDARTVSELGNGSSKAGAQKLYKMMDRVHNARKKAGRGKDSKAERFMPA